MIDTVLVRFVDMQGRLMGKRFHAVYFVETSYSETHCCNYLLATDLEMATIADYAIADHDNAAAQRLGTSVQETSNPVRMLELANWLAHVKAGG